MELGDVLELLRSSLPHSLAGTLHHHGGHLHQRCRILLVEELLGAEIVLVLDIYIIYLVPHLLVDCLWLHHIPTVGIGYDFSECAGTAGSTLHLLLDIGWIEDGGSALDTDSLLHLLHSHIAMVAIVGEISIRILTGYVAHSEVHTSHEFIYVVETQSTPSVALSWLNHHIGTGQRCLESSLANGLPVLLITVVGTHIVHIDLGNLTLLIPAVACGYHLLDTGTIVAVYATKDTIHTNLACLLWRHAFLYEHSFGFGNTGFHQVVVLITLGICRHLYRLVDEEETGCCQVAELTGSLNHDIDARTAQLLGWDETQIGNTTEGISYRFYTEHIENLSDGSTLCFDKLATPERVTHLTRIFTLMSLTIHLDGIVAKFLRLLPGILRWRILYIDGEEIPTGRQSVRIHNQITTRRWGGKAAIQGIHQRRHLVERTLTERLRILAHILQGMLYGSNRLSQMNLLTGIFRCFRHHHTLIFRRFLRCFALAGFRHLCLFQIFLIPFLSLLDGFNHLVREATGLFHLLKSLTTHLRNLLLMRNLGSTELAYRTVVHPLRLRLLRSTHLVCHLHHHLDRIRSCLHRLNLASHLEFGRSDSYITADVFIRNRG